MISFLLFVFLGILLFAGLLLRVLGGIFFPWLRRSSWQKPEEPQRKPEGSVSIDYMPPRPDPKDVRPGHNAPDADYVEYEEVKDPKNS